MFQKNFALGGGQKFSGTSVSRGGQPEAPVQVCPTVVILLFLTFSFTTLSVFYFFCTFVLLSYLRFFLYLSMPFRLFLDIIQLQPHSRNQRNFTPVRAWAVLQTSSSKYIFVFGSSAKNAWQSGWILMHNWVLGRGTNSLVNIQTSLPRYICKEKSPIGTPKTLLMFTVIWSMSSKYTATFIERPPPPNKCK